MSLEEVVRPRKKKIIDKNELRIEKLGMDHRTNRKLKEQRDIASIFTKGILSDNERNLTQRDRDRLGIMRYQYIYKNFIREIRMYFIQSFKAFRAAFHQDHIENHGIRLNKEFREQIFLLELVLFVIYEFCPRQLMTFFDRIDWSTPFWLEVLFSKRV